MKNFKEVAGWLLGYFAVLFPIFYALDGDLIDGLGIAIVGLIGAIFMLKYGDRI